MKQNKYPVLFLTMGSHTTRYVPLNDLRCKNTMISMNFANSIKALVSGESLLEFSCSPKPLLRFKNSYLILYRA